MIKVWKKIGQTPLELLKEIRQTKPLLQNEILSYAGRLDPMAEGETIILIGKKENQERDKYLNFNKEYVAEIVLGFSTDSHDLLGLISNQADFKQFKKENFALLEEEVKLILANFLKKKEQKYPVFSSKTVLSKPLFVWYKSGKINEIEIPSHQIKIVKAELIKISFISLEDFYQNLKAKITLVKGDFRQTKILSDWFKKVNALDQKKIHLPVLEINFEVSSGTYIRGLAHELGDNLKIPACLYSLKRNKIFNF